MKCSRCSAEAPEGSIACPECGKNLAKRPFGSYFVLFLGLFSILLGVYWIFAPSVPDYLIVPINYYYFYIAPLLALLILIIQLIQTKKMGIKYKGDSLIVLSFLICFFGIIFPEFIDASYMPRKSKCQSNIQQLGFAICQYRQDYNGRNPLKENWCGALMEKNYTSESSFYCPFDKSNQVSFGYNALLSGVEENKVIKVTEVVLLVDSAGGKNASGGKEIITWRHKSAHGESQSISALFYDGHAERVRKSYQKPIEIWDPFVDMN